MDGHHTADAGPDHLGGPGYLTAPNFEKAADLNFSGRCTPRQAAPEELASEILVGYESARKFALSIEDSVVARNKPPMEIVEVDDIFGLEE